MYKKYIGVKEIKAKLMTIREAYEQGYIHELLNANVSEVMIYIVFFDSYYLLFPKDIFEEHYKEVLCVEQNPL